MLSRRPQVLWFGKPPDEQDQREARNRRLELVAVQPGTVPSFRFARAAVFWATSPHFESTIEALEVHILGAINEGLFLFIVVGSEAQRKDIARALDSALPKGAPNDQHRVRMYPVEPHEASNTALMHNPGPTANDLLEIVTPAGVELGTDQQLLLRRAFHDCRAINLRPISRGRSGAQTFLVAATLAASNAGPQPVPFFAKLGASRKLRQEMERFAVFAEHHVRWYLRPNFLADRRIYGVEHGILVGTFVDPSRSLSEVVLAGEGPPAIRALFEETLSVLRQEQEFSESEAPGSVFDPLEEFCGHDKIPSARVEAAEAFGGTVNKPRSLWRKLIGLPQQKWRRSAIHGDMHGENVRVRRGDAIVIDFAHAKPGPMSADLASLEVHLAFSVCPAAYTSDREAWTRDVEVLYRASTIDAAFVNDVPEREGQVLHACLKEIRRLAGNSVCSTEEYKRVLAVYLLRHASFPPDPPDSEVDEFRRAYAYWLANRLVISICADHEPRQEAA